MTGRSGVAKDALTVQRVIARIPSQATGQIRQLRENAVALGAVEVVEACDRELRIRGTVDLSPEQARMAQEQAAAVEGKPLRDVIVAAFRAIPARDYEVRLLRVIAANPDATYSTIVALYGKRDAAL